jgi:spore coat polysaccharide biosynthesis protein SpsF (cytidylyltransferase family)
MRPTHERLKLDARVTLDTPEDYELLLDMFDDLYRGHPVPVGDVVSWLTNHPARRLTA